LQKEIFQALQEWSKALSLWRISAFKGTQAWDFIVRCSHFFHHSIKIRPRSRIAKNFKKLILKVSDINVFLRIPCCRRKRTVSLSAFSKNDTFHSVNLPITWNFTYSLNTLYTAKNAQCYSAFSPTTISWTRCCRRKREVSLRFFAKNAQYKPKMRSCKDNL
jgi:hypothetical protein